MRKKSSNQPMGMDNHEDGMDIDDDAPGAPAATAAQADPSAPAAHTKYEVVLMCTNCYSLRSGSMLHEGEWVTDCRLLSQSGTADRIM